MADQRASSSLGIGPTDKWRPSRKTILECHRFCAIKNRSRQAVWWLLILNFLSVGFHFSPRQRETLLGVSNLSILSVSKEYKLFIRLIITIRTYISEIDERDNYIEMTRKVLKMWLVIMSSKKIKDYETHAKMLITLKMIVFLYLFYHNTFIVRITFLIPKIYI